MVLRRKGRLTPSRALAFCPGHGQPRRSDCAMDSRLLRINERHSAARLSIVFLHVRADLVEVGTATGEIKTAYL